MASDPIYVDKILFLGRVEEQKQFRAALKEVLAAPAGEDLPYILHLFGDGGMGKTTLAKRFRDIARDEKSFKGKFQSLWVDWEYERDRYPELQVGREHISPETVFDVIHANAVSQKWGRHFGAYQKMVEERGKAEKKAAEALAAGGERDEFAGLRGAGAGAIAKALRFSLPIGATGEQVAKAFLDAGIKVAAEQAAQLRAAAENRLRARLDPKQFDLFLNPNDQLARALAEGLGKAAASKPFIVFLDTYEIVDRADIWLRVAMHTAGPRVVWIVSGRDNLVRSGPHGKGYADEFQRRLLAFDMRQLAEQDIRTLFAEYAPERALDDGAVEAISQATRGVPLALNEAAEMWERGVALTDIVGDSDQATPRGQIVPKMTARYLLHAVANPDKQALYALALAGGDVDVLRAMLRPASAAVFDLDGLLRRLERNYASVYYTASKDYKLPRLHDAPALFLREYLKDEVQRKQDDVRALNLSAAGELRARLQRLEAELPRLEDRYEHDDWTKAALGLTKHLFWLDESEAWHWLIPRLVESLAYSRELQRGLLHIATDWKDCLSQMGKKRLKALGAADNQSRLDLMLLDFRGNLADGQVAAERLDELTHLESLGWLKGDGENERGAILAWQRGRLLYAREKYAEASAQYERAERGLPPDGDALKTQLGEALYELAGTLMWPQESRSAIYSDIAERILPKVVAWLPEKQDAWYRLGVALKQGGKLLDAISAYQRAIELDPKDTATYTGLGNAYTDLGRHDEALAAYQRAIELDPKDATPHNNIAFIYLRHGKFDDARREYAERIRLSPENTLGPLVALGSIARHQGLAESDEHFAGALAQWEVAWRARWSTSAGLLADKAQALLCLGKKGEALETLKQSIAQMLPGDKIDFYDYELLRSAPVPPDGIEEMIAMLKEAEAKRQGK